MILKKSLLTIIILTWSIIAMGIPIGFYLSNNQASFLITATPIILEVGYPRTSLTLGNSSYLKVNFQESTPVVSAEISARLFDNAFFSLSLGEHSDFGRLEKAINNGKIKEIVRNFALVNVGIRFFEMKGDLGYSRFYSSISKNISKNIFFLTPPNYSGEAPNAFFFKLDRSFDIAKDYVFTLLFMGNICFSDSFVFSNPSFEVGISLFTTVEELQANF